MIIRRLARPMLAAVFISGGVDTLLNPSPRVAAAEPLVDKVGSQLPDQAPSQPEELVKIDAGVKIAAGTLLALGKFPRLSSLALAASMIPTTYVGHPFWERSDPQDKAADRLQFLKNLSILGGLVLAAVDTEGKPSLGWRGRRAARKLSERAQELTGSDDTSGPSFSDSISDSLETGRRSVIDAADVAIGTFAS